MNGNDYGQGLNNSTIINPMEIGEKMLVDTMEHLQDVRVNRNNVTILNIVSLKVALSLKY